MGPTCPYKTMLGTNGLVWYPRNDIVLITMPNLFAFDKLYRTFFYAFFKKIEGKNWSKLSHNKRKKKNWSACSRPIKKTMDFDIPICYLLHFIVMVFIRSQHRQKLQMLPPLKKKDREKIKRSKKYVYTTMEKC